jgi:hypothetical protein
VCSGVCMRNDDMLPSPHPMPIACKHTSPHNRNSLYIVINLIIKEPLFLFPRSVSYFMFFLQMALIVGTVNSTSGYTLLTLYHTFFKGINVNIEICTYVCNV